MRRAGSMRNTMGSMRSMVPGDVAAAAMMRVERLEMEVVRLRGMEKELRELRALVATLVAANAGGGAAGPVERK